MPPNPRRLSLCTACGASPRRGALRDAPSPSSSADALATASKRPRLPKLLPELSLHSHKSDRSDKRMVAL